VRYKENIMRDKMRFAGKLVGAGALTALLATAAVAAPAPRNGGQWNSGRNAQQRTAPQTNTNRAVRQPAQQFDTRGQGNSERGQQGNVNRGQVDTRGQGNSGRGQQGNVYRGQVDTRRQGNYGYRQPASVLQVRVDIGRQGNYGYGYQQQGILRGVVEGINPRYGTMTIREEATGRFVNIDMQQMSGRGMWGLRLGEFVTVLGQWEGGNAFAAYQIN
jgi:hypothetical protein